MSSPNAAHTLLLALRKKAGFEAVSITDSDPDKLRVLGRVPEDRSGLNMNNWKILMWRLCKAMEKSEWKVDFSKSYFIKPETDKLVFAWRILLQGKNIAQHYAAITTLVAASPVSARVEVTEVPLVGASADRNSTQGGKRGAGRIGTVKVGPMAVAAKNMGG